MTYLPRFSVLTVALLLSGCGSLVNSHYDRPDMTVPAQWQRASEAQATYALQGAWWQAFNDPALNALQTEALASNNSLAAAAIRVQRAQLNAGISSSNQWPSLSAGVNGSRSRANGVTSDPNYSANVGISYELDLWGKLGNRADASRFEAEATAQDKETAALALTGTVATTYWKLGYLNQRIAMAESSLAYAKQALDIAQTKYQAGAVSALDLASAEQAVANQNASYAQLQQQRVEARNAFSVLFNSAPGKALAEPQVLPMTVLPPVPAGLPTELLSRRPDLRAAELRLRATLATADATKASYYPALSLTGSAGSSSNDLAKLLSNPVQTIAASLSLPFLNWNSTQLNIKVARSQFDEAVVTFRQTLYEALSEVENALSNRAQLAEQARQQEVSLAAARKVEAGNEVRYKAGKVALKIWLDAQESRRQAEIALADAHYNQLANYVTLVKTMGGAPLQPQ